MDLSELYQEVILDHSKRPRNFGPMPDATHDAEGYNPLCGDQVHVLLRVVNNEVQHACFEGCGCAISTASASLMTELIRGKSVDEIRDLARRFRETLIEGKEHELGELEVLCGVKSFPMRVKCATLAWHAALAALEELKEPVSTEETHA